MKAAPFDYVRANTLAEVFQLWREAGPEARLLAGGQSLIAALAFRLSEPSVLIDISRVADLTGITLKDGSLRVGALTTHAELGANALVRQHAPLLAEAVPLIAHPAIRNRGTLGGSLAYADPAAELPACCVALGATIVARSATGERRVAAEAFFLGLYATALEANELIAAVEFPLRKSGERSTILELARRAGDYAMAGIVVHGAVDGTYLIDPRIVLFGVGEVPVTAGGAMAALAGRPADAASIAGAQAALAQELDPPADLNGGADMKRHLAQVLLARAIARLVADAEARAQ
jgi:carbon-monoxide dehydrogenase medium subunit